MLNLFWYLCKVLVEHFTFTVLPSLFDTHARTHERTHTQVRAHAKLVLEVNRTKVLNVVKQS